MADNFDNYSMKVQARVDLPSNKDIDAQIRKLEKSISKLKVSGQFDDTALRNLTSQLNTLKASITTANFSPTALTELTNQVNRALQNINIGNINVGNIGNQAQQVGQQIGATIAQGVNSAIQKSGGFKSEYLFDGKNPQNKVTETVLKDFQKLSDGIVTVKEQMKSVGGKSFLDGFTVSIEHATGQVETLAYKLKDIDGKTGQSFQYTGGSINDNGVIKQMNAISAKADSLQTKLDKLKANYSDANASRPIKDIGNISALSQQYDKVAQAIENVRSADNSTFSSMVSNAQKEITTLETMVSQFRNAENVATQMKSVDISSGIAQAQERLGKLKANASGFEQMTDTIRNLDIAIEGVGDKASLDAFINDLRTAETQLGRVKAEAKHLENVNKIQLLMSTGGYESRVDSLIGKTQQWVDANGNARISTDALQTAMNNLNTAYANITATGGNTVANQQALIEAERALDTEVKKVQSSVTSMNATMAKSTAVDSLRQKVQQFYDINSKSHRNYGAQLQNIMAQLASGTEVPIVKLRQLSQEFINIQNSARQAGKLGLSFFDTLKQGMKSFSYWTSSTFLVMKTIQSIKSAVSTVTALDTALVDLKKTTTMTTKELEDFYYASNDVAKQMGVTTEEILKQASSWSRLGYSSQEAAIKMAKYSSMFATISPGMDLDSATDGLVSVMKAFKIDVDDVVDGIMSKINIIGNTRALSNSDIVDFLIRSSAAMAEANNSLEDTIALGTAITEITRDASSAGQVLKTVSMRIRGYDEETEEFVGGVEELSGKIADLTKTAKTPGGISLFSNEAKTEYKSTRELFDDISEIYQELNDKQQAGLLEALAGKRNGQAVAAILNNYEAVTDSLNSMANSAGNAEKEMSIAVDSIDFKVNKLKETGTGIAQNLFQREDMKTVLNTLTSFMEMLDKVTEKLGLFGSIGLGVGLFAGIKNAG